ncbi:MAG: hypothetical protein RSE58_10605 [Clostridia bacterium]
MKKCVLSVFSVILGALLCLCACTASAAVEFRPVKWHTVQQTLACDGRTVVIDAITDLDIPLKVNEWSVHSKVWTEEELRQAVAVAAPEKESMVRSVHPDPEDIMLVEETTNAYASSYAGCISIVPTASQNWSKYDYATIGPSCFYIQHEPAIEAVPPLAFANYQQVISELEPLLHTLHCEISMPDYVEAWDMDMLVQNDKHWGKAPANGESSTVWTLDDELYTLHFPAYFQGVRLHADCESEVENMLLFRTGVDCSVSAAGVLLICAEACMFDGAETLGSPEQPLSIEEAIERYRQMRANMVWEENQEIIIDKILLEYAVMRNGTEAKAPYHLIPMWCFYYKQEWADLPSGYDVKIDKIHALTGEPLQY